MDSTQDSTAWILDLSYWIPNSLKVRLGFQIPVVRGIRDSLTCIPDSTAKVSLIPESGFPYTVQGARFTSKMSAKYILLFFFPFALPFVYC